MLLDECVPQRFRHAIEGHEVSTVPHMGWASEKNGKLLGMAEQHFDVFVTTDQNLRHQQSIADFDLAVVVLEVQRNKLEFLLPLVPTLHQVLDTIRPGQVSRVVA